MEDDNKFESYIEKKEYQKSPEKLEQEKSMQEKGRENMGLRQNFENKSEASESNKENLNSSDKKADENSRLRGDESKELEPLIDYDRKDKNFIGNLGERFAAEVLEKEYGIEFNQLPDKLWEGKIADKVAETKDGYHIIAEVKNYDHHYEAKAASRAFEQLENTYNHLVDNVKELVYVYINENNDVKLYKFTPEEFLKFENAKDFTDYIMNHKPNKIYHFYG